MHGLVNSRGTLVRVCRKRNLEARGGGWACLSLGFLAEGPVGPAKSTHPRIVEALHKILQREVASSVRSLTLIGVLTVLLLLVVD